MPSFNGVQFDIQSNGDNDPAWERKAMLEERDLIGGGTDVHFLGLTSAEIELDIIVNGTGEFGRLQEQNGKRGSVTIDGTTKRCVLSINGVKQRFRNNIYIVSVRFKEC